MITNLINLFSCGGKAKSLVNCIIRDQSRFYNLLSHIVSIRSNIILSSNKTDKVAWQKIAMKLLQKYFLLITIAIYLHETQEQDEKENLQHWLQSNPPVLNLYRSINLQHIDNYLNVDLSTNVSPLSTDLPLSTSGSFFALLLL